MCLPTAGQTSELACNPPTCQPPSCSARRLAWALVHSRRPGEVQRGIGLAEALTDSEGLEQRDLLYLVAVGRWRQRKYIEARRTLRGLMQVCRGGVAGGVQRPRGGRGAGGRSRGLIC